MKFVRLLLVSAALLVASLQTIAQQAQPLPYVVVVAGEDGVTANDRESAKRTILETASKLGRVTQPRDVRVNLLKKDSNAFASGFVRVETPTHLFVPRLAKLNEKGDVRVAGKDLFKNPVFTRAVIIHEYGHLVLRENLGRAFPEFNEAEFMMARMAVIESRMAALMRQIADLEAQAKTPAVAKQIAKLQAQYAELQKRDEEQYRLFMSTVASEIVVFGLHEFFADVVAVAVTGDPSVVRKALFFAGSDATARKSATYRDFNSRFRTQGWNEQETHGMYAPARSYLGARLLGDPKFRNSPELLVQHVWLAIRAEVAAIKADRDASRSLSVQQLNERLISRL